MMVKRGHIKLTAEFLGPYPAGPILGDGLLDAVDGNATRCEYSCYQQSWSSSIPMDPKLTLRT
jgi:hypothetical protein